MKCLQDFSVGIIVLLIGQNRQTKTLFQKSTYFSERQPEETHTLLLLSSHNPDPVLFQPVVDLQQIRDGLGSGHELSVPRLGIVWGVN